VTESELIQQARDGDAGAWEALTLTHQQAVFRFAYLLLGDPDEADDATQETFLRAYYSLERFDDSRPLRPWLMQIVSNLASNRRRSLARYFGAMSRLARQPVEASSSLQSDDSTSLWLAVQRLKFDFQQVIYLRYFLDMSEDEMCAALNLPAGTVKSRLHRALSDLRQVISRQYPHLEEALLP
jgi:RNA polymerase sigma-70 factor (ECF subfamily)